MEQEILENSNVFTLFPILSLIIFFIFFTVLLIWVLKMNKKILKEMSEIPFNNDNKNIKRLVRNPVGIIEGEEL